MMDVARFYCPLPLAAGVSVALPEGAARHATRVLRLGEGDELTLFNGEGGEYRARITSIVKDRVLVEPGTRQDMEREPALQLVLVQALQAADKMDFTVQKATELGVARVVPVASRRSVVRLEGERATKRVEHWRQVAASACEQCGRNRVPGVAEVESLTTYLGRPPAPGVSRLMLAPGGTVGLAELPPPTTGVELLVGAEGGLDQLEIEGAARAGFVAVRLGPRILRTETAGLAALAAIHALWGDFA